MSPGMRFEPPEVGIGGCSVGCNWEAGKEEDDSREERNEYISIFIYIILYLQYLPFRKSIDAIVVWDAQIQSPSSRNVALENPAFLGMSYPLVIQYNY